MSKTPSSFPIDLACNPEWNSPLEVEFHEVLAASTDADYPGLSEIKVGELRFETQVLNFPRALVGERRPKNPSAAVTFATRAG